MINPFFSIIIPTFNAAKTIEKCINSILNQSFSEFEIIIADGLSTDETIHICRAFNDDRILIHVEKDKGVYDAMNKGIGFATGSWLYFLGSDDYFYHHKVLDKIKHEIDRHPNSRMIYGNVYTSADYVQKYDGFSFRKLLDLNICHQAIFYHRSVFNEHTYDLKYEICADWDLNLKIFNKKNAPLYVDEIIAAYNLQGLSGDWRNHPDYLHYFQGLKKALRYKGPLYLAYLYLDRQVKSAASFALKMVRWTFRS